MKSNKELNMNAEELYLLNKFEESLNSKIILTDVKIILIDKNSFRSYIVYCNDGKFKLLKKSKKYKHLINQFKSLFPNIDFSIPNKIGFKFIRLFENEFKNEIIIGIQNNQVIIGGGHGIYEI